MEQDSRYKIILMIFLFLSVLSITSCSDGFIIYVNDTNLTGNITNNYYLVNATYNITNNISTIVQADLSTYLNESRAQVCGANEYSTWDGLNFTCAHDNAGNGYSKAEVDTNFSTQWAVNLNAFQSRIYNFSSYPTKAQVNDNFSSEFVRGMLAMINWTLQYMKLNQYQYLANKTYVNANFVNNTQIGSYYTKAQVNSNFTSEKTRNDGRYMGLSQYQYIANKTYINANFSSQWIRDNAQLRNYTHAKSSVNANFVNNTNISGYVPYSGARNNINLGTYKLTATANINATNLISTRLTAANCDVKSYSTNGSLYCGTDATGAGGYASSAAGWTNTTTSTNTSKTVFMTGSAYRDNGGDILYDDFTYWTTARTNGIGLCAAISSGTAVQAATVQEYIGTVSFSDSTTINGGYQCASDLAMMYFIGGEKFTARMKPNTNVVTTVFNIGFGDAITAANHTDGCWIQSRSLVNYCMCANSGTFTTNATTYTTSAGTWYRYEVENNLANTKTTCRIKNAAGTSTLWTVNVGTNRPITAARAFGAVISGWQSTTSAAAILGWWDFVKVEDLTYT